MTRLTILKKVISVEDQVQAIYDKATKKIKGLPLNLESRVYAKAVMKDANDDARELILRSIKDGAKIGEEEAIRKGLEEMRKGWPV